MSGRPPICKFYKQGHCSYGSSCRFYHPAQDNSNYGGGRGYDNSYNNTSYNNNHNYKNNYNNRNNYNNNNGYNNNSYNNRKTPFNSNNNYNNSNNSYGNYNNANNNASSSLPSVETPEQFIDSKSITRREAEMRTDMDELNEMLSLSNHIFTSYSLKPPAQINILPSRDFSFEEDRIQYYAAGNTNALPQYELQMTNRHQDMLESAKFLKLNTQKAVRYLQLTVQNPNLVPKPMLPPIDINAPPKSNGSDSIFGSIGSGGGNPFNQQLNPFGGASNPFGASSTKPSNGGGLGAFGNQNINSSPFPSQPANTTTNASPFGSSGFGKQSTAFGSTGFGSSTTGTSTTNNPFGSSATNNPFGSSATSNPFGSPATPSSNPFGASATTNNTSSQQKPSPFGGSSFGQSGFGSSSTQAQTQTSSSPFGSSTATVSNPFGSSLTPASNPFGSSATPSSNPFGSASTTTTTSSPFGNSGNTAGGTFSNQNVFQNSNQSLGFGQPSFGASQRGTTGYKQCDAGNDQTRLEDVRGEILQMFKAAEFELGKVPDIPPPIELC